MTPQLVEFPNPNLKDVPTSLRRLADEIESGEEDAATALVILGDNLGNTNVRGYGARCSAIEAIGWITLALARLTA